LAGCYRRLGKYSASLRAYASASDESSLDLSEYCAWAQVELELGLMDEASVKFEKVLSEAKDGSPTQYGAAFSLATCTLAIARQNVDEGKFGAALSHLTKGIELVYGHLIGNATGGDDEGDEGEEEEEEETIFACSWKLLGDLYSSAAVLPPSVFATAGGYDGAYEEMVKPKLAFVARGEDAYLRSLAVVEDKFDNDENTTQYAAAALCDIGTNLFLQAQIRCESSHSRRHLSSKITDEDPNDTTLVRSTQYFLRAIDLDDADPRPWAGLGCALSPHDPLLAQHALCRSLQLDRTAPHPWANLGLLYGEFARLDSSEETIDALTQVADTPVVWIGRALLEERRGLGGGEDCMRRAADAYRAALQVGRHPAALLGLACTSSRGDGLRRHDAHHHHIHDDDDFGKESRTNLSLYLDLTSGSNIGANMLGGVMNIDAGDRLLRNNGESRLGCDIIRAGTEDVTRSCKGEEHKSNEAFTTDSVLDSQKTQSPGIFVQYNILLKETPGAATLNTLKAASLPCAKIEPPSIQSSTEDTATCSNTHNSSLSAAQRSVREHPDVGERWLKLAKRLVTRLSKRKRPSKNDRSTAVAAVARANYILSADMASKSVRAKDVADALALSCHLADFMARDVGQKRRSCVDLQRALILDPENRLARAKLESVGN